MPDVLLRLDAVEIASGGFALGGAFGQVYGKVEVTYDRPVVFSTRGRELNQVPRVVDLPASGFADVPLVTNDDPGLKKGTGYAINLTFRLRHRATGQVRDVAPITVVVTVSSASPVRIATGATDPQTSVEATRPILYLSDQPDAVMVPLPAGVDAAQIPAAIVTAANALTAATQAVTLAQAANAGTDSGVAGLVNQSGGLTDSALGAKYLSKAQRTTDTTIGAFKVQQTTANWWHKGYAVFGNNTGLSAHPRQPFQVNNVIDGSTFITGEYGSDVVGNGNNVVFTGGFTGEVGFGTANPHDLVGANDYIISKPGVSGAIAGITSFYGRIVEAHINDSTAALGTLIGLRGQVSVDASGATCTNAYTAYLSGPASSAGTITNAYTLYLKAPSAGTNQITLYVEGLGKYVGTSLFTGALPNGSTTLGSGTYVGRNGANSGMEMIASGSSAQVYNPGDGSVRIMKTGASVVGLTVDTNASAVTIGAGFNFGFDTVTGTKIGTSSTQKIGFWGATPVVRPAALPGAASDLTSAINLLNQIRATLITLGLVAGP